MNATAAPALIDALDDPVPGRRFVRIQEARSILTPASGFIRRYKFTLNPYSGCGFGCGYCYARFFRRSEADRESWGQWVAAKANAPELIAEACLSGDLKSGDAVYMSSVTDPYQPVERRMGLTRAILEALLESGVQPRLTIQTRSPIAARDIDLFRRFERIRVNFSIPTDSEEVRVRYEPHAPSISARFKTADEIARAGVPIGVSVTPMLPIKDMQAFGARLAGLNANGYSTQYLKPERSSFGAASTGEALRKAEEDGWGIREYSRARECLAGILGPGRKLFGGAGGYGPVG